MEIIKESVEIYDPMPFGVQVCPDCCGNIGNNCYPGNHSTCDFLF
ncbi:MAG: hypothetical protein ACRCXT_23185 [Paraclostridium sp.]